MNIVFAGMTGEQISYMLTEKDGKTIIDYDAAKEAIETARDSGSITNADQRLQMIENLRKAPNQELIPIALKALGITADKVAQNPDKTYDELAEKGLTNFMNLAGYMKTN